VEVEERDRAGGKSFVAAGLSDQENSAQGVDRHSANGATGPATNDSYAAATAGAERNTATAGRQRDPNAAAPGGAF